MFIYSLRRILAGWLFFPKIILNQITFPFHIPHGQPSSPCASCCSIYLPGRKTKGGVPSFWPGLKAVKGQRSDFLAVLGWHCGLRQGSRSPFCRLCAHLLSGAVSDRPHESWDGRQYLQILYHVRPPRGLWAFCCQHEPRCCDVVQQAPPNVCQRAEGSSPDRGNVTRRGWTWQGTWAKTLSSC